MFDQLIALLVQLPELNGTYSFQRYQHPDNPSEFLFRLQLFPIQSSECFDAATPEEVLSKTTTALQAMIDAKNVPVEQPVTEQPEQPAAPTETTEAVS